MVGLTPRAGHASAWTIVGANAVGARHLDEGAASQDAFAHARFATGDDRELVFLAVADGAGSAARSAEGAAIAVGTARDLAGRRLGDDVPDSAAAWHAFMTGIALATVERLQGAASVLASDDGGTGPFGCTLAVAVIADPWAALMAIGDSFAVVRRDDGGLHLPHVPLHPGDDVTQTDLLSGEEAMSALTITVLEDPGVEAVVLASDGLDRAALVRGDARPAPHGPFLVPLIEAAADSRSARPLARYLLADAALTDSTDDDRTLLIAVRQ